MKEYRVFYSERRTCLVKAKSAREAARKFEHYEDASWDRKCDGEDPFDITVVEDDGAADREDYLENKGL